MLFFLFFIYVHKFIINIFNVISLWFTEIEAVEACKWLRAAGFPQYAQMYEGEYHIENENNKVIIIRAL